MKSPNESIANEIQPYLNARVKSTLKIQDFKIKKGFKCAGATSSANGK